MLLDTTNCRVGYAKSADDARRAVTDGRAATWAAIPRHGVTAIDLDALPAMSLLAADFLTDWCRARGLWWLLRESGRAGHLHLWVYSGQHTDDLADYTDAVRRELGLTRPQLDVRSAKPIRPLAAPHRNGTPAPADQLTADHLADLTRRIGPKPLAPRRRRPRDPQAPDYAERAPKLRRRHGSAQPAPSREDYATRHEYEFAVTLAAYNSGLSEDEAWEQVAYIDGGKAAEFGRRWWKMCMWDDIRPAKAGRVRLIDAQHGSLPAIRARLAVLPNLDPRQAKSIDMVLWVIGEHIGTATKPVPVSERDVQGATGLHRRTIRRALARAVAAGIIERHEPARCDQALAWAPGPAMTAHREVSAPPCLMQTAPGWLHTLPPGSATALTLHLAGLPLPADLASLLSGILDLTREPAAQTYHECPAWPSIKAERDTYHERTRSERAAYAAQWQADRALAARRARTHALAWKRTHLARLAAQRPQPALPRLDCLPSAPTARVTGTARHTDPAHPACPLASSGDAWTAPRPAPWTASPPDQTPPPAPTGPHGRQQTVPSAPDARAAQPPTARTHTSSLAHPQGEPTRDPLTP